jgi:hypothetical protein
MCNIYHSHERIHTCRGITLEPKCYLVQLSRYCYAGDKGEKRYSSYSFLTSALDVGEWSASRPRRALPLGILKGKANNNIAAGVMSLIFSKGPAIPIG